MGDVEDYDWGLSDAEHQRICDHFSVNVGLTMDITMIDKAVRDS